jgi:DNA-binding CsgD family transcriptional regulator
VGQSAPGLGSELRATAWDRERGVALLERRFAAGLLTTAELSKRVQRLHAAATLAELDAVLDDLPRERPRGFRDPVLRAHALVFVLFGGALVVLWLLTRDPDPRPIDEGGGDYWALWAVFLWGLALAVHALHAFGLLPWRSSARDARGVQPSVSEEPSASVSRLDELTEREREILALVGRAYSNKEIARELVISERTARSHVSSVLRKLGLSSRTEAALLAVHEGLAPSGERPARR